MNQDLSPTVPFDWHGLQPAQLVQTDALEVALPLARSVSQSPHWLERRRLLRVRRLEADKQGTSASASVSLVRCYADLIIKYWEHLLAAGQLDVSHPLPILQWGAGTGRFAYRLLRELRDRLAVSTLSHGKLRYVACEEDAAAADSMREHPYLRHDITEGRLVIRHIAANQRWVWRDAIKESVHGPAAPLVVIANDVLMEAEQELVAFLDGKTFDATVDHRTGEAGDVAPTVWSECETIATSYEPWKSILQVYATRLDNVPVLLPAGALDFVAVCSQLSHGRYLLLATDFGIACERQLRAGVYADVSRDPPVNFDALSRWQRVNGALTWTSATDPEGRVMQVALGGSPQNPDEDVFATLVNRARGQSPGDAQAMLRVVQLAHEELTCEQLLATVRIANEDPRMLAVVIQSLLAKLDSLTVECCTQWREAIERVWVNYFPACCEDPFCVDIGTLAMHVQHWGVAKSAFTVALALYGDDPELLHRLSYCEASTGHSPASRSLIQTAISLDPRNRVYLEFESVLRARLERWSVQDWYCRERASDGELTLEPLGPEHAESLLFQYRDPQIGAMTRLPELKTREDVLAWLDEQRIESGREHFAVMHTCWGFVGVVSTRRYEDSAYFYFWIGADYQGAGLGQRAARLLFEQASAQGVQHIFTSAYASNRRSRDALQRLGFDRLDVSAASPDEDLLFFHRLLDERDRATIALETKLRVLLHRIDSPIGIVVANPSALRPTMAALRNKR